jgi:hypothetical protein
MAPAMETASFFVKILSLLWEIYKTSRNSIQISWRKAGFKFVSSLTTLEFVMEEGRQVAYYVQDRTVYFRKDEQFLPPFLYGTDGADIVDELIVNEVIKSFRSEKQPGGALLISPSDAVRYAKKTQVRAVLLAHSEDGFPNKEERFDLEVREWFERATVVVVFPKEKKPENVELYYQAPNDNSAEWRPAKKEKVDIRRTTRGRTAFALEMTNAPYGSKYSIRWKW